MMGQVLKHEYTKKPSLVGAGVFGLDDVFGRIKPFVSRNLRPLPTSAHGRPSEARRPGEAAAMGAAAANGLPPVYFASVDIRHCYDTVNQVGGVDVVVARARVCACFFVSIVRANRLTNEKTSACSEEKTPKRIPRCRDPLITTGASKVTLLESAEILDCCKVARTRCPKSSSALCNPTSDISLLALPARGHRPHPPLLL